MAKDLQKKSFLLLQTEASMSKFLFCLCLLLTIFSLLQDLRTKRLLHRGMQTQMTRSLLRFWPLQAFIHLFFLYLFASSPISYKHPIQVRAPIRVVPGPFTPSFPPLAKEWKKKRVERL